MSWLDRLFPVSSTLLDTPLEAQLEPWVNRDHLESLVIGDLVGTENVPTITTRAQAMRVPAVSRARHLTAGTIAAMPLLVMRGADLVAPQPAWAEGSDGQVADVDPALRVLLHLAPQSSFQRLLWTVDDLLFHGHSLWVAGHVDADGFPTRLARVPYGRWRVHEGAFVDVDSRPITLPTVYIPGPHEGILGFGAATIAAAAQLERTAADVAARPFRLELHQTTDAVLTPDERRTIVSEARKALADNNGILFTNRAMETKDHPLDSGELLIGGRNNAALDVARHVSMPAAMIDATAAGASLEYANLQGRNQHWLDYGLSLYMNAITARLGMDDVVPRGQRVALDTDALTSLDPSATGPATDD